MANKKYKLTDGNYWATDGIHDFGQNKTQREINAALVQADSDLSDAISGQSPYRQTLPNNTDLDDVTTFGTYWVAGNYSYTNVPDNRPYGLLEVKKSSSSSNIAFQFFIYEANYSGARYLSFYYRLNSGGVWYPWYRIDGNAILSPSSAISIPSSGSSVSYDLTGMTADHHLVKWGFSESEENNPPCSLQWDTYSEYFKITNNGGSTSETIKPVFVRSYPLSATVHS